MPKRKSADNDQVVYDFAIGERTELVDVPPQLHPSWNGFTVIVLSWSQRGLPTFPSGMVAPTQVRLCAFGGNAHPHAWIAEKMLLGPKIAIEGSTWTKFKRATGIDIRAQPTRGRGHGH